MPRINIFDIEFCKISLSTFSQIIILMLYVILNSIQCDVINLNSESNVSISSNCADWFLALEIDCPANGIIDPHSLSFPLRVCVCACVAEKGSSRQNNGRRCTGGALEMKSITSYQKKVLFLLNMKGRVLPMLLSMHTKSMFLFSVENLTHQSVNKIIYKQLSNDQPRLVLMSFQHFDFLASILFHLIYEHLVSTSQVYEEENTSVTLITSWPIKNFQP